MRRETPRRLELVFGLAARLGWIDTLECREAT